MNIVRKSAALPVVMLLSAVLAACGQEAAVCGDGTVDAREACDDGNTTAGDGCSAECSKETGPVCGNGTKETGEACDDGNSTSGDGCSKTCAKEAVCGNGTKETGEGCDDGNTDAGDGCSDKCVVEAPVCGNNKLEGTEECDDGNTDAGDGCDDACQIEQCDNSGSCESCQPCALQGACADLMSACAGNAECIALNECVGACADGDQTCLNDCLAAHPDGAADLQSLVVCVICQECPVDCNGTAAGCQQ